MGKRDRPRRSSVFARGLAFLHGYTEGLSPEELRRLVGRDAPRMFAVLLREREAEAAGTRGIRRWLRVAKLLFLSISEKLSPARRLIFAVSLLAALLGTADVKLVYGGGDGSSLRVDAAPIFFLASVCGLLFLLAGELVERVLVRDEIQVARQLQGELLPKQPPVLAGWAFAHSWRTANDIGGDYHQFHVLPDGRLAVVIADASGHGMAAGLLMAIADSSLHIALDLDPDPGRVAEVLHRAILRTGDRRSFLTLFYGLLDPATGDLEWICAGHPSPLLRHADGRLEEPASGSLPLGMRESVAPVRGRTVLAAGDQLVLFTDGLFEALDTAGEAFGYERLRREVAASSGAADSHERLRGAVERHAAGEPPADDRTIVVVERLASAEADALR